MLLEKTDRAKTCSRILIHGNVWCSEVFLTLINDRGTVDKTLSSSTFKVFQCGIKLDNNFRIDPIPYSTNRIILLLAILLIQKIMLKCSWSSPIKSNFRRG